MECFLSILENVVTIVPRLTKNELVNTIQMHEDKSISELELRLRISNIVKQSLDADEYGSQFFILLLSSLVNGYYFVKLCLDKELKSMCSL